MKIKQYHTNQISHCRVKLNGELNSSFELSFTLRHQNNDLIYETNRLTDRKLMRFEIISYLHNEMNWSYRKITKNFWI